MGRGRLGGARVSWSRQPGAATIHVLAPHADRVRLRETYAPGWTARLDGRPAAVVPGPGPFFEIQIPSGEHEIFVHYDPPEVRLGLAISALSLLAAILGLTGSRRF